MAAKESQPPLTQAALEERLQAVEEKMNAAHDAYKRLEREYGWLRQGLEIYGGGEEATPREKPTLRDAIITVMETNPADYWTTEAVIAALGERNWLPTGKNAEHTTRGRLAEMTQKDQLVRIGRGVYALPNGNQPALDEAEEP
jgi:hypothetical protein